MRVPLLLAAVSACSVVADTGRPPRVDSEEADDTAAGDTAAGDTAPPQPATVTITNATTEPFTTLWVCDDEWCLVDHILDPSYAAPGAALTYEVDPGLTILAVIDAKGRCAATDWFPLDPGETWAWEVTNLPGEWPESEAFGCDRA